ncbi:MAG: translocation/assembly module TamB domain-containing protein, partial [Paracoccaceae bacterium]
SRVSAVAILTEDGIKIDRAEVVNPQVTATATGSVAGAVRRIAIEGRLANLGLLLPEFPGPVTVSGTAVDDGQGYLLDLAGRGPGQIDATVQGRIGSTADLAIRGTAQAALANAFIDPRAVAGAVRFDLGLRGPLAIGSLSGTVSLDNGRIADPSQNFALQGVAARVNLQGGTARVEATAGVSSGGTLAVRGSVGLSAPNSGDLAVDLSQVKLRDPDLYETTINGTVTVQGPLTGGAMIAGRLALTETELNVPSTGFGGAGDLPGLVHLREAAPVRATRARAGLLGEGDAGASASGPAYGLNLLISAPNRLFVRGRGLDAELGGQLTLTGTTANIVPFGAFNLIRGRIDILTKRLVLSEALLQMEGALIPYLSVKASNESDGYTASVQIDGPATDPAISFTSDPDLPEEEVLARLLFGQGLSNLSAFQAAQLASAVATLAGRGGEGLVSKLRRGTGLDNLDVKTDATGAASVTAGKYLTEKLYTEVTVGQEGKTRIDLNLDISKHITLKAGSDSEGETGIGVYLEKDY